MAKSIKALVILFLCAYAIISCVVSKVSAEDLTTGNLLPNAGDGVDWGASST